MKELQLSHRSGMNLLGKKELERVLSKTLELSSFRALTVKFIYNVELHSLSINFWQDGELVYWFLFQAEKLNKSKLRQLHEFLQEKDGLQSNE